MNPDWNRITLKHVDLACELHDSGSAKPKRAAKNTFLLLNGKKYPAKFIRGLAYCLATGVELDPNQDYSGGAETVMFFQCLGLATQHGPSSIPKPPAEIPTEPLPASAEPESRPRGESQSRAPHRREESQKEALWGLLRRSFGEVVREIKFPWLTVPQPDQMQDSISAIYRALQGMRGFSTFASFGKSLCCDFFVPAERLVIEYDERQHFTLQRARSLELYPRGLSLGFDSEEWLNACRKTQATDPTPPYRDEQRAFYDSLRDIQAVQNGIRLIRLRYGTFDWTGPGTDEHLCNLLAMGQARVSKPAHIPIAPVDSCSVIEKVAVVSHDYNLADRRCLYDYSEHFARINKLCDEQGCDTILYALYTWDQNTTLARNHDAIFGGLAYVRRVILEVGQPPDSYDHVEVWLRDQRAPVVAHQRFAQAGERTNLKRQFIDDLPARVISNGLLVLCGESGIVKQNRSAGFTDNLGFLDQLDRLGVTLILNPIHDYMAPTHGIDMRDKRQHYSQRRRTVISVWNQGNGRDNQVPVPWTVFHDNVVRTDFVRELLRPFSDRPDIRIGIVDVSS